MAYTFKQTHNGPISQGGHTVFEVDVDVASTDTALAGVGGTIDVSHTEGPSKTTSAGVTTYKSPYKVECVKYAPGNASDGAWTAVWDTANDDASTGTVRIKITNGDAVTADGLAGIGFRVLMHFRTLKAGGVG